MKIGTVKSEHKKCFHCGARLKPVFKYESVRVEDANGYGFRTDLKRVGIRGYGYESNGLFCTLNCGFKFAVKVARRALELKDAHE